MDENILGELVVDGYAVPILSLTLTNGLVTAEVSKFPGNLDRYQKSGTYIWLITKESGATARVVGFKKEQSSTFVTLVGKHLDGIKKLCK